MRLSYRVKLVRKRKTNTLYSHIYMESKKEKKMVLKNLVAGQEQRRNGLEDTGRENGKLGRSERVALTYIHYQM